MLCPRIDVLMAAWVACMVASVAAAGTRVRGAAGGEELLYRGLEEEAGAGDQVVLVSDDAYRLYRARAEPRQDDDVYRPRHHATAPQPRIKEAPKQPPVQTIRNYNKVNDDGSFTFGYEAADGSFKEETRGTDCVVRGKYGYVDPDGNKREFTYVSGNPCDPNRPDEEEPSEQSAELDDDGPANYPTPSGRVPLHRPVATTARPAPTTYFQNDYRGEDEEEEPLQQVRPRVVQRPRPALPAQLAITPRPQPASTSRALPPPTTFRPQLLAVPVPTPTPVHRYQFSPSPSPAYSPSSAPQFHTSPRPTTPTQQGTIDFAAEFAKFQRDNSPQPSPNGASASPRPAPAAPLYSTELVFDPASGHYDTQLFQALPQTKGELNLNQRLQSFVPQPQPRPFLPSQPAPAPLFRHQLEHPAPGQDVYQRQQAETQYANSAQLFQQQQQLQQSQLQRDRAAARAQAQRLSAQRPAYYLQRAPAAAEPHASGQIDSFLRQHGIQF